MSADPNHLVLIGENPFIRRRYPFEVAAQIRGLPSRTKSLATDRSLDHLQIVLTSMLFEASRVPMLRIA